MLNVKFDVEFFVTNYTRKDGQTYWNSEAGMFLGDASNRTLFTSIVAARLVQKVRGGRVYNNSRAVVVIEREEDCHGKVVDILAAQPTMSGKLPEILVDGIVRALSRNNHVEIAWDGNN